MLWHIFYSQDLLYLRFYNTVYIFWLQDLLDKISHSLIYTSSDIYNLSGSLLVLCTVGYTKSFWKEIGNHTLLWYISITNIILQKPSQLERLSNLIIHKIHSVLYNLIILSWQKSGLV